MKLTLIIFDYWKHWITLPNDPVIWSQTGDSPECRDGLMWHDGYWATFWYMLNLSWFEMNDLGYGRGEALLPARGSVLGLWSQ